MARRTASSSSGGGSRPRAGRASAAPTGPDATAPAAAAGPDAVPGQPTPLLHHRPPAETAALRASLADSAAQTAALRASLDELRRRLDSRPISSPAGAPAGTGPAGRSLGGALRRRRTPMLAAGVLGLLLISVAVALVAGRADRGTTTGGTATGSAAASATAGPSTITPSVAQTVRPLPWPGGPVLVPAGVPATGAGVDAPGTDVSVALDRDGVHLDVFERAVLTGAGPAVVPLAPASTGRLKGALGTARLQVTDLQVELNGQVVTPAVGTGPAARGWRLSVPAGTARLVLRYRVSGALVRETPAPPGRTLVLLTPLTASASLTGGSPVLIRYLGAGVNGMTCPEAPPALVLCGQRAAPWWTASLSSGPGVALVQATLP